MEVLRIRVNVTEKHIKEGRSGNAYSCMVHKALEPRLNKEFGVTANAITFEDRYDIKLPEKVGRYIRSWDRNKKSVLPFTFTLDVPAQFVNRVKATRVGKLDQLLKEKPKALK